MKLHIAAATAAFALIAGAPCALAHSWYTSKVDPAYKTPCCGGTDCGQMLITDGVLTPEANGYHIRLSLDQTRKINPSSMEAVDAIVTWDRVQQSEDGNYHICLMAHHLFDSRGGIYCLFAPPNS
jgi:hypothetical protein